MLPDSDYQILRLTDLFYKAYPNPPYREIMAKQKRAYNCVLFQTHYDYFICVPYRSEIHHANAFLFQHSKRAREHSSGLDYSKIIIITNMDFIDSRETIIDRDEYTETVRNIERIKSEALQYVEEYVAVQNGMMKMSNKVYRKKYHYSTLRYFHGELGIESL